MGSRFSRVVMILAKDVIYDGRVQKESLSLSQAGHSVVLAYLGGEGTHADLPPGVESVRFGRAPSGSRLRRFATVVPRCALLKDIYRWVRFTRHVFRAVPRSAIATTYHSHDLPALPTGVMLKLLRGGRLVYDAHELYPEMTGLGTGHRLLYRILERLLVRFADAVITVNPGRARLLAQRLKIRRPLCIRNCPVTSAALTAPRPVIRVPRPGNAGDGCVRMVYLGGLQPGRGLERALEALSELRELKWTLTIAGWGRQEDKLRNYVTELGLEDRVQFCGPFFPFQSLDLVRGYDLGLALYEDVSLNNHHADPNKLYEYIVAGVPVMGSQVPGVAELIKRYGVGLVCDLTKRSEPRTTLERVITDPELRATLADRCAKSAHLFTWERQARVLLRVYDRLRESQGRK